MKGLDLAQVVTTAAAYPWDTDRMEAGHGLRQAGPPAFMWWPMTLASSCNILRMLAERGCKLTVVPAQTPAAEVLALNPDGVFLSNGPGDPAPCDYAITAVQQMLETGVPTFGICLGHQIMALASGARTFKMQFSHHGANHPVKDLDTGPRQHHQPEPRLCGGDGVAAGQPACHAHVSLFDGTLQGLVRTDKPAFCFQGHPEASPGPHDIAYLFDRFTALMDHGPEKK
jgi:carbamoyl-phosphate synthase small subunit